MIAATILATAVLLAASVGIWRNLPLIGGMAVPIVLWVGGSVLYLLVTPEADVPAGRAELLFIANVFLAFLWVCLVALALVAHSLRGQPGKDDRGSGAP
ncbi:MAG: hypothetical protein ACK4KW_05425 [Gemmobacter sp.]